MTTQAKMLRTGELAMILSFLIIWSLSAMSAQPPLIPRSVFFENPQYGSPSISPDGTHIAYENADTNGIMQIWVRDIAGKEDRQITHEQSTQNSGSAPSWAYDGKLLYLKDTDGNEMEHLFACDPSTGEVRDLTPFPGMKVALIDCTPERPNQVLITANRQGQTVFDAWSVDLSSGALQPIMQNPGDVVLWMADTSLKIRAVVGKNKDGSGELRLLTKGNSWKTLYSWRATDTVDIIGLSEDEKEIYLRSNRDADTTGLYAVDTFTGRQKAIFSDPTADIQYALVDPVSRIIQAAWCYRLKPRWEILDKTVSPDFAALAKLPNSDMQVMGRDLKDRRWVVSCQSDINAPSFYLWDRAERKATDLFSSRPDLKRYTLSPTKAFELKARDGFSLPAYLTLPVGIAATNLPMVLLVHGGPRQRDFWSYNWAAQWLANRGYAVLEVNYRGSSGFGKAFMHAGDREFAGKMQDDLIDGVNWAIKESIADPKHIAIMGASYGGYATLVGLTFTPDVFAAGVDECGFSNLQTFVENVPAYWKPFMTSYWYQLVGNPENPEDRIDMKKRSPLFRVENIKAPLLVGQGANDPRVKKQESDQMVAAMRAAGKPVDYIVFPDEGHGFSRPENVRRFYAATEQFLALHLGGRFEPAQENECVDSFRQ
jgi:dipeptidyl aminopeptidase/acylaminoacyl peptidase